MSFSQQVKNELGRHTSGSPDELVTALAVMLLNMSCFELSEEGEYRLHLSRGSSAALTKCFTLLKKTANISYELASGEDVRELAALIDILDEKGCIRDTDGAVSWSLLSNERCVRSYLRNLFLCIGSVSDPARNYHLEFVCAKEGQAAQLMRVLEEENYHPQMNFRRGKQVVSVRDAQQVADLLTLMGAHASLLDLENARVIRQVRGQVNRRVNCETSNIQRSVDAARRQLEDIELVMASSIFAAQCAQSSSSSSYVFFILSTSLY